MPLVLITGAGSGIGRASALALARAGWTVLAGVRRPEDGEALREAGGPAVEPLLLDVTDEGRVRAAAETVRRRAGERGLQGLVNNAGIAAAGPVELIPEAVWRQQLEVNVVGVVAVTRALLPALRQGRGRIVLMGSVSGLVSLPFMGPYSASKFALEALADALRIELAPWGIAVSIIEPGSVVTPIWTRSAEAAQGYLLPPPPGTEAVYPAAVAAMTRVAQRNARHGLPPEAVARAVVHALTAARPRARYLVAAPERAREVRLLRWLPAGLRDRLVLATVRRMLSRSAGQGTGAPGRARG
ncbi:SDR family oxidoreductase [Thermaerobacter sp. PB12/4term]|uniref:SDR family oxidoreductase n=1 Tax=Thermaerobacter sp. PB12/4term TaxID=2293838 RepID=UPI000E32803D|nr:SDR family oxidoreductase [Thermaerobacter sp. PB12/4term]QIA27309.1 SDR family oxidoreductase [Thermaerobacter sp. PB12/4term]